jgi:hypothetical protein
MTSSYLDIGDGVLQPIQGAGDAFVATYRGSDGAFVRGRTFGSTGNDVARGVAVDSAGAVFVAGNFAGTADFGGGPTSAAGGSTDLDAFVAKYSPTGAFCVGQRPSEGAGFDSANAVATDAAGNVRVAGKIGSPRTSGSTTLTTAGGNDAFVAELSSAGAVQWAKNYWRDCRRRSDGHRFRWRGERSRRRNVPGSERIVRRRTASPPPAARTCSCCASRRRAPGSRLIGKGGTGDESAGRCGARRFRQCVRHRLVRRIGQLRWGRHDGDRRDRTRSLRNTTAQAPISRSTSTERSRCSSGAAVGVQTGGRVVVAGYQGNAANTSIDFGNGPLVLVGGASWDGFLGAAVP